MRPKIATFKRAENHDKQETEWHHLCVDSPAYQQWKRQKRLTGIFYDIAFSMSAGQAYSALFELRLEELPHSTPSQVIKLSGLAGEMVSLLPVSNLLPGNAKNPVFQQGLVDLKNWRPSELPEGISANGNPVRRWMIRKFIEEFIFSFEKIPPFDVAGHIIRLGWSKTADLTIQRTMDAERFLEDIVRAVKTRREHDNKSTTVSRQAIAKVSATVSKEACEATKREVAIQQGATAMLPELERQLTPIVTDDRQRARILSIFKAALDDFGYPQADAEYDD